MAFSDGSFRWRIGNPFVSSFANFALLTNLEQLIIMSSFVFHFLWCIYLLGYVSLVWGSGEGSLSGKPKYFLSVMVLERNQTSLLREFVRHYLEEGVDHFFVYNSMNAPHVQRELDCIDSKYYTVLPHVGDQFKIATVRQNVYEMVRNQTEWLAVVDPDDFISSRAYPNNTIRELLDGGNHAVCKIITVPSINYAWGNTQETPVGNVRITLTHRWGYEPKHNYTLARKTAKSNKFADSFERTKNRLIVNTQHVRSIRTNSATLYKRDNICVASTAAYMSCAHFAQDPAVLQPSEEEGSSVPSITSQTRQLVSRASNKTSGTNSTKLTGAQAAHLLPRFCPERNTYRGKRSMSSLFLQEQDIPGLSLAVHHYAIRSQKEWNHLSTLYPTVYPPAEMGLANRMDVVDPFMQGRVESRREQLAQVTADKALQRCDLQAPREGAGGGGRKRNNAGNAAGNADDKNGHLRTDKTDKQSETEGTAVQPVASTDTASEPIHPANSAPINGGAAPETSFMEVVRSFFSRFFSR